MNVAHGVGQGAHPVPVHTIEIVQTLQCNQAVADRLRELGQDFDGIEDTHLRSPVPTVWYRLFSKMFFTVRPYHLPPFLPGT